MMQGSAGYTHKGCGGRVQPDRVCACTPVIKVQWALTHVSVLQHSQCSMHITPQLQDEGCICLPSAVMRYAKITPKVPSVSSTILPKTHKLNRFIDKWLQLA
eukprot:GHRR01035232.1.p1 GENE.GHRR01035232.1~~GHRR01035232.1.p1  ORF type:complete len:102 (-),score=10.58 GHRR01035232.1:298-603(-)